MTYHPNERHPPLVRDNLVSREGHVTDTRMWIGRDHPTVIELKKPISKQQQNVLHILGEYPNRLVTWSDITERLGVERSAVQVQVTRLRKCLTSDWLIQQSSKQGYRLIDLREK